MDDLKYVYDSFRTVCGGEQGSQVIVLELC